MGEQLAYVRVSSKDQNEQRQLEKIKKLGVSKERIYIDKKSGKDFERPKYQDMRKYIRKGDLLYIDALDRLGRDYDGVIAEWKYITRTIQADIVALDNEMFDSRKFKEMGDIGKLLEDQMLATFAYVAQNERKKILERQADGIRLAQERGVEFGRPKVNLDTLNENQKLILKDNYSRWINKEITAVYFMKLLELKKNSFYKVVKLYEDYLNEYKIEN